MEETKVLDQELVENVAENIEENAPEMVETAAEAIKTVKESNLNAGAIVLLVITCIGLLASGGWIVFGVIFLVKKIKAAKAKADVQAEVADDVIEAEDELLE